MAPALIDSPLVPLYKHVEKQNFLELMADSRSSSNEEEHLMPRLERMSARAQTDSSVNGVKTPDSVDSAELDDPVVIVGMACRLPGGVSSPHDFWKMLVEERSGQCRVPRERFNAAGYYHPEGDRAGVMNTEGGYFLQEDVRQFENSFFGINNVEATYMDPQQRKLLEVVYECFESSGASLDDVAGANVGVYVGNFTVDFQTMQTRDPEYLHRYSATGSGTAILANRLSYIFDLRGPSFTLDTACSSSIYCLHNAVVALQAGDCEAAVVAGANLITAPEQHLGTMKGGVLSATSTCHTFDASADGYGRAEGVSALYVKRLSTAIKDGDPIRAVIRGTAINANGKTSGITQPSISGQAEVIRKAYRKAGLDPRDTAYVECHGTGTGVGDPMEVEALSGVFTRDRPSPLLLGANKTNLGHSEAASGISAVMKAVLTFENKQIPATIGVQKLNPKLHLDEWNMQVVTRMTEWPSSLHRASINSFGYGGANAHAIIESVDTFLQGYNGDGSKRLVKDPTKLYMLPFSGSTMSSLEARITSLSKRLNEGETYDLDRLSYTLASRRSTLGTKGYLLAEESNAGTDIDVKNMKTSMATIPRLDICFAFTGQGAQWPQMGKELLQKNKIFSDTIDRLDKALQSLPEGPSWNIRDTLSEPAASSKVGDASFSQPLCTAIQIGIVNVLKMWGLQPKAVLGHSSGEIAAAYAAGLLTEALAIVMAFYRGYTVVKVTSRGSMCAVGMTTEDAQASIDQLTLGANVNIACVNSPESVTISGDAGAIDTLMTYLQKRKVFNRKLATGGRAYHSHLMREIGQEYERLGSEAMLHLPLPAHQGGSDDLVRFFSSVGKGSDALQTYSGASTRLLRSNYWRANLENPVQFSTAVKNLVATGSYHIVEIGPHSALELPIKQIRTSLGLSELALPYSPSLARFKDADVCLKTLAGVLFLIGHNIDFSAVNEVASPNNKCESSVLHDLPPYHWSYGQLLWNEPRSSKELRNKKYIRHELLGSETVAANGIERCWRNILKPDEVPWMQDHLLESQVVYPAAGYLAMAIEAISQIKAVLPDQNAKPTFVFRNVNILSALVVSGVQQDVELFTTMYKEKISNTSTSDYWYDFSISSVQSDTSVVHCNGSIGLTQSAPVKDGRTFVDATGYDKWNMSRWYEKLAQEGLRFGPQFQTLTSMKTDKARIALEALSTNRIFQRVPRSVGGNFLGTYYPIHPLVIDSCLQAAIMGGTAGNLDKLKAFLPVNFGHVQISTPEPDQLGTLGFIHTRSQVTGFSTRKISATLKDVNNNTLVDLSETRLALFDGKIADETEIAEGRHPTLRVIWKPDITRLLESDRSGLEAYLEQFVSNHPSLDDSGSIGIIAGLVDLAGHKNPRLRVMEVDRDCDCNRRRLLDVLDKETDFPRSRMWDVAAFSTSNTLDIRSAGNTEKIAKHDLNDDKLPKYDLIVMPQKSTTNEDWTNIADHIPKLAESPSMIVCRRSAEAAKCLRGFGCQVFNLSNGVMFALAPRKPRKLEGRDIFIIETTSTQPGLVQQFKDRIAMHAGYGRVTSCCLNDLSKISITPKSIVFSLMELEQPLLTEMTPEEMNLLRKVTDNATDLIWLNGAAYLNGKSPDLTLASGLSRAMILEQPSLNFKILDVGAIIGAPRPDFARIIQAVENALVADDPAEDKEFVEHDGLLHVSRFLPDNGLNSHFSQRRNKTPRSMTLEEASPAQLAIKKLGIMDTIYFQQLAEVPGEVPAGMADIDVKAVSLNAKDIYVLSGKVETRKGTAAIEFSGVVRAVANDVADLKPGDRVCVLAPNSFRTLERVPAWACHKMLPDESFEIMPTLPVIYGTALYALDDRAHLRKGETILIHSGAGAFGLASIAIAQMRGATVYATVSTEDKKNFLVDELGVARDNIFQSRDTSFVDGVMGATDGKGVDVVLNSLTGDLLHASWRCCANFGRFVEVGKRDIVDAGKLDMHVLLRNVTFTAFDLTELYYHEDQYYRDIWINKSKEALELYRAGAVKAVPIKIFDVSEITQAYRYFSQKSRVGKVVVSIGNPKSTVKAVTAQYTALFHPDKSYVLIGCLGGLGRSLSKWMFNRGARNFTFLGRSATDKPAAREVVRNLEKFGATVQVVRGDVSNKSDVEKCISVSPRSIGGVVQAAMGLSEALFSTMSHSAWHTGIQPKWRGTWNIHEALEGHDSALDFFLLTSSVSGSVGTATESNYCSANGFLDAFARYRRSLGKPVTSIGFGMISEVGYLHENPEIEALLLRKGIQPLNEEEFLQVIDLSLSGKPNARGMEYDKLAQAHILTGLEPLGIRRMMEQGFDVNNGTMQDPRALLLSASLDPGTDEDSDTAAVAMDISWSKGLPVPVVKALAAECPTATTFREAILALVRRRFSNLLLMPLEKVNVNKGIASFGMDSMIAAEYRSWFWSVFKVDIPFLDILSQTNTLEGLAGSVEKEFLEGMEET